MAYDVGTAKGKFILEGLREQVILLKRFVATLEQAGLRYKDQRKQMNPVLDSYRRQSALIRQAIGDERYFAGAIRRTNQAIKERQGYMQWFKSISFADTFKGVAARQEEAIRLASYKAPTPSGVFAGLATGIAASTDGLRNYATFALNATKNNMKFGASLVDITRKAHSFTSALVTKANAWAKTNVAGALAQGLYGKLKESVKQLATRTSIFARNADQASKATNAWWRNFGRVAIGFSIAYRLINAVEYAVAGVTEAFKAGIQVADDYRSSVAQISGMLALLSEGLSGFKERYELFKMAMAGTMRESYRLMPEYGLTTGEISDAYRELAQFGVVVEQEMVRPSLNTIAVIKEIASTTQQTSRQVRQEIQALFTGQKRVTDQFGRMIYNSMPELAKKIFGIAKANTTNAEKWRLVIQAMNEFNEALIESRQNIGAQMQVAKNSLSIISMLAIQGSGIYKNWLDAIRNFNKALFDKKGNLTEYGKKIYVVFYRGWQIIDITIKTVGRLLTYTVAVVKAAYNWNPTLTRVVWTLVKIRIAFFVVKELVVGILGITKLLLKPIAQIAGTIIHLGYIWLPRVWFVLVQIIKLTISWATTALLAVIHPIQTIKKLMIAIRNATLISHAAWYVWVAVAVAGFAAAYVAGMHLLALIEGMIASVKRFAEEMGKIEFTFWDRIKMLSPGGILSVLTKKMQEVSKNLGNSSAEAFSKAYQESLEKSKASLKGLAITVWDVMLDVFKKGYNKVDAIVDDMKKKFAEKFPELAKGFEDVKDFVWEDIKMPPGWEKLVNFPGGGDGAEKALQKLLKSLRGFYDEWFQMQTEMSREMAKLNMDPFDAQLLDLKNKLIDAKDSLRKAFFEIDWEAAGVPMKKVLGIWEEMFPGFDRFFQAYYESMAESIRQHRTIRDLARETEQIRDRILDKELEYNTFKISEKEFLEYQVKAYQNLIENEKRARDQMIVNSDEYIAKTRQIEEAERKIIEIIAQQDRYTKGAIAGFKRGMAEYTRELGTRYDAWRDMSKSVAEEMQNAFSEFWLDVLEGDLDSFEDFFISFGKNLNKILADMLARMTMQWIAETAVWKWLFGLGTGAGVGSTNVSGAGGTMGMISQIGGLALSIMPSIGGGGGGAGASAGTPTVGNSFALLPPIPHDKGGWLTEPILGVGRSGQMYSFVEDGKPEKVLSNAESKTQERGDISINAPISVNGVGANEFATGLQRYIERQIEDYVKRHV